MHVLCTYKAPMKLRSPLSSIRLVCLGFLLGFSTLVGRAAETATATISSAPVSGTADFDYTILLKNTGTTTIGTFWFSWIPGQDYMATAPISTSPPANWAANITHGGTNDGFAIQWVANSAAADLAAGSSLTFSFESAVTPGQMAGNSPFFPTAPVETSFIYSGAPFSDNGFEFTVVSVPEPSSVALLFVGALGISLAGWRRMQARSHS